MRLTCVLCVLLVTLASASAKSSIFDRLFPKFNEVTADSESELPAVPLPLKSDAPASRDFAGHSGDKPEDADSDTDTDNDFEEENDESSDFWIQYFSNNSTDVNGTVGTNSSLGASPATDNADASALDNKSIEEYSGTEILLDDSQEDDESLAAPESTKDNADLGPELTGEEEDDVEFEKILKETSATDDEQPPPLVDEMEPTIDGNGNANEDDNGFEADLGPELTGGEEEMIEVETKDKPKEKPVHLDGDAHPSPDTEPVYEDESGLDSESDAAADSSSELTEGGEEMTEPKERPVHLNGDVHPSLESSDSDNGSDDASDEDNKSDMEVTGDEDVQLKRHKIETDKPIHVDGDVHPSSLLAETEWAADDESDLNSESDLDDEDRAEKGSGETESVGSVDDGLLTLQDDDEDDDNGEIKLDAEPEIDNDELGNGDEADQNDGSEGDMPTENEVTEDPTEEPNSEDGEKADESGKSSEEENNATQTDVPNQEPLVEVEESPVITEASCDFEKLPYSLTIKPTSVVAEHGKEMLLNCTLIPINSTLPLPQITMKWTYRKTNCKSTPIDEVCTAQLATFTYEAQIPQASYQLTYKLTSLNQTLHGGQYTCMAITDGCPSQNSTAFKDLNLRVYVKPNYLLHIGIISGTCIILLAILAGLVAYGKKVQDRSKSRYQELLSTVDIQYQPKVLELPNSVYNPTTVKFSRMSASSSKSSFSSVEEA